MKLEESYIKLTLDHVGVIASAPRRCWESACGRCRTGSPHCAMRRRRQLPTRERGRSSWLPLQALPRLFRQASIGWVDDNVPRLGASVAFYTLLSLAPVIVIAVALAAFVYGQDAAQGRLASEIQNMAGPEVARTIQAFIQGAYQPRTGVIATVLGLTTLVFGASSIFVELHEALNTIWHVSPRPTEPMPPLSYT